MKKRVALSHRAVCEHADAIPVGGFSEGGHGMPSEEGGKPGALRGVWLADHPLGLDQFGRVDGATSSSRRADRTDPRKFAALLCTERQGHICAHAAQKLLSVEN
jgi:hypothetical protein